MEIITVLWIGPSIMRSWNWNCKMNCKILRGMIGPRWTSLSTRKEGAQTACLLVSPSSAFSSEWKPCQSQVFLASRFTRDWEKRPIMLDIATTQGVSQRPESNTILKTQADLLRNSGRMPDPITRYSYSLPPPRQIALGSTAADQSNFCWPLQWHDRGSRKRPRAEGYSRRV